nr:hypothetical protein [Tanacetum cinerariifolium]
MALVQGRGHGGDNDVPWQPPSVCKNEKACKKARDLTLKKKFADNHRKPLPIKFDIIDQETVKPIGPNAHDFTSLVSNEIERKVPFYYDSWENIPESVKTTLWPKIKGFFNMVPYLTWPNGGLVKKGIKASFKGRWKDRKSNFKKHEFVLRDGYKEPIKIRDFPPTEVKIDEWRIVVRAKQIRGEQDDRAEGGSRRARYSFDQIMSQVLGDSRGFLPGRGRRLPNSASASSSCSAHSDPPAPPMMSQEDPPEDDAAPGDNVAPEDDVDLEDDLNMPFVIWNDMAEKFDMDAYALMLKPVVIAVSSTWVTSRYRDMQSSSTRLPHSKYKDNHAARTKRKKNEKPIFHTITLERESTALPVIDDGTGMATVTCFSTEVHTFVPDCNEVGARPENPDFTLDVAFKPSPQPLLSIPPPHSTMLDY